MGMDDSETDDYVWFSESFKRYKELVMFEMEYPVQQLDLSDDSNICILSHKSPNQQIISLYKLPAKIARKRSHQNLLTQSSDIKFTCGIFPDLNVVQICTLYGENKILTTEDSLGGINIYEFDSSREGNIIAPIKGAEMSLLDQSTVVLAKDALQEINIIDLKSEKNIEIQPEVEEFKKITPCCISSSLCCFSKENGCTTIFDLKTKATIAKIPAMDDVWTISSNYNYRKNQDLTLIGLVSSKGDYRIFDLRSIDNELLKGNFEINNKNNKILKLKFSPNSDTVAVSGHNGTVDVYRIDNEVKQIFSHDGHKYMENCAKKTIVTDHLWYDNDCIISGADNTSLVAGSFVV